MSLLDPDIRLSGGESRIGLLLIDSDEFAPNYGLIEPKMDFFGARHAGHGKSVEIAWN